MSTLDSFLPKTHLLLGHIIDLHDSEWVSYDLTISDDAKHLLIDWALPGSSDQNMLRAIVLLSGITLIDMPPKWESVYRWTFEGLDSGLYHLHMTENHEGKAINIVFSEIKEVS